MPAEWEPHQGTVFAFPFRGADWPGKFAAVKWAFVEIVRRVAERETVYLLVADEGHRAAVESMLARAGVPAERVEYRELATDRGWMRDSGPIVVEDGRGGAAAVCFGFNGWAKYGNHRKDAKVAAAIAGWLEIAPVLPLCGGRAVVLEGGSVDFNGAGALLTTEECLLDPDVQVRNPGLGREDYEAVFEEFLGARQVIWLGRGIEGDDTHGHVDDICRFVSEDTVVAVREPDGGDPNHRPLEDNWERLASARLADGRKLNRVELPMPGKLYFDGVRLPASYANFIFVNGGLLMPTFNDPNDYLALGVLRELFPGRVVLGIHAVDLVWGFGTLHCLSRQIPLITR